MCRSSDSTLLSVNTIGVKIRSTKPIGTFTNITQRQPGPAVRIPPRIAPTANPNEAIAPTTPKALFRSGPSAKVVVINDSAVGAINAAPNPCTPRVIISHTPEIASPPASEANEKRNSPAIKSLRLPYRSPIRPPSSKNPPNVSEYALMIHCRFCVDNPRSFCIDGKAIFTIEKSNTTINWATHKRANASPFFRVSSA